MRSTVGKTAGRPGEGCVVALPLRIRDGRFQVQEAADALARFARCFFSEYQGAVPDDPEFGGRGIPWGTKAAPLLPLEPVIQEFRNRYGTDFGITVSLAEGSHSSGEKQRVRIIRIALRSTPGLKIEIEI